MAAGRSLLREIVPHPQVLVFSELVAIPVDVDSCWIFRRVCIERVLVFVPVLNPVAASSMSLVEQVFATMAA